MSSSNVTLSPYKEHNTLYIKTHTYGKIKFTHYKMVLVLTNQYIMTYVQHKLNYGQHISISARIIQMNFTPPDRFEVPYSIITIYEKMDCHKFYPKHSFHLYTCAFFFTFDACETIPSYVGFLAFDTFLFRVV